MQRSSEHEVWPISLDSCLHNMDLHTSAQTGTEIQHVSIYVAFGAGILTMAFAYIARMYSASAAARSETAWECLSGGHENTPVLAS